VGGASETERVNRIWDRVAPAYDKRIGFFERHLFEGGREWVCSRARGATLEIAVGTGRNLALYPDDVDLTGIELSEAMLALARERAARSGRAVHLRRGDAQALDFPADSFDTVTCTISLCSIPDHAAAIREVRRVLRPGGRFVAMEHVRSASLPVRAVQRAIDPLTVRFEGDHVTREPLDHLTREGFRIDELERLKWGIVERVVATKPS
jgi:ubiquinone/menaquinone biosynthesis C-methylase UbiE